MRENYRIVNKKESHGPQYPQYDVFLVQELKQVGILWWKTMKWVTRGGYWACGDSDWSPFKFDTEDAARTYIETLCNPTTERIIAA